jgi:hypothetical protein
MRLRSYTRLKKEYERRRREENERTSLEDLPDAVVYQLMCKLDLSSLSCFLIANPRASSVHGVHHLWQKKITDKAFNDVVDEDEEYDDYDEDYESGLSDLIKQVKRTDRVERLLQYKHRIITQRYTDLAEASFTKDKNSRTTSDEKLKESVQEETKKSLCLNYQNTSVLGTKKKEPLDQ